MLGTINDFISNLPYFISKAVLYGFVNKKNFINKT